jgi:phosphoenolpyruvate carboxykinase (GTP)
MFLVNWFRKDTKGKYLWPGYRENMRVLQWIIDRCDGRASARETPVGWTPRPSDLEMRELGASEDAVEAALRVDTDEWREELAQHAQWLKHLGSTVPRALTLQHDLLVESLEVAAGQGRPARGPAD